MMVWYEKKKCCRTLRHSVSFFYGGLYTTKSFLIDGRLVLLGNSETLKRIKDKVMPSENSIFTFMVLIRKKRCRCPKTSFGKFERSEDALGGKQTNLAI